MSGCGEVTLDIGPGADNPRNSEGGLINLNDGRILFAYSRFSGSEGHDDSPSDIAVVFSEDDGRSWCEPEIVVTADSHKARNVMSVSLIRMNNGDVGLFYGARVGTNDCRIHLRRSSDEGKSWSVGLPCIEPPAYYVVNNDRIVRLSSGRIVIPAAFHRNGYDSFDTARKARFDRRAVDVFFLSDDEGVTWIESDTKCAMPHSRNCRSGLQEPGLVELDNGVLWAYARTDLGVQYEMYSLDSGESWTPAEPSRFSSPQSPLSVKRVPGSQKLVAVWNPIPNYNGRSETVKDT
ncbi:MAG: exo-alpha-sialidase, partial [Anaerolineae bacterium]|nr:exo-alpha-sialidase [Anaerolineae bacterium]